MTTSMQYRQHPGLETQLVLSRAGVRCGVLWCFMISQTFIMRELCGLFFHTVFTPNRERTLGLRFVQQYRTFENYYAGCRWIVIPEARSWNKPPLMELGKYGPNIMRELCGSYAGCRKYKFVIHDAGNYAGSIEWHELVFCAQASWKKICIMRELRETNPRNQLPLTTIV